MQRSIRHNLEFLLKYNYFYLKMSDVRKNVALSLCLLNLQMMAMMMKKKQKRKPKRRWWVHPINAVRSGRGEFAITFQDVKLFPELFYQYTRMSLDMFNMLLDKIAPCLSKNSFRESITPEQRLIITIKFLASGVDVRHIALQFRIGVSTAHYIIDETCQLITQVLMPEYLKQPNEQKWKEIAHGFYNRWNLPNCLGAVDGKHVRIQAPPNSGSLCFNYKKTFSSVLMAACDHEYKFTIVDIGAYGSESDGGIFARSAFGQAIDNNHLDIPLGATSLPGSTITSHYFFVGDEAFKITRHMMRPYPGKNLTINRRIFNYRLSRARRIIENAFGILVTRWRIFKKPISKNLDKVEKIIAACVCLHNFILTEENDGSDYLRSEQYADLETSENDSSSLLPIAATSAHRTTNEAYIQRENLCRWILSPEGAVPWQLDYVLRGQHGDYNPENNI